MDKHPAQPMQTTPIKKPSFREALEFWTKLGFISFGGPAGQIAIMHEYLVDRKRWISDSKFLHALNYCMILPGPEAQQLATYIGWLLHGTRGGLAAGILFVLPSMFILLGLSAVYVSWGNIPWVYALFEGLKPAVIAIVILALIKIGKKSLHSFFHYALAAAAFVCIFFLNIPFPYLILTALALAVVLRNLYPQLLQRKGGKNETLAAQEAGYYLNRNSQVPGTGFSAKRLMQQTGIALLLWVLPLLLFYSFSAEFDFWQQLCLFFTKAALVTFGGAYAVLPYVAQVSVEQLGWLSKLEMIDGLALGETTPGPLIMVLAFVGFMAGHNHYGQSVALGSLGLFTTVYYTFLPCFLFILAGAPIIEKTQENQQVKEILGLVTAAVVGVILNLTLYLGLAVIFPEGVGLQHLNWASLFWTGVSFLALYRFNIGMIRWIGISALFGLLHYLLA